MDVLVYVMWGIFGALIAAYAVAMAFVNLLPGSDVRGHPDYPRQSEPSEHSDRASRASP